MPVARTSISGYFPYRIPAHSVMNPRPTPVRSGSRPKVSQDGSPIMDQESLGRRPTRQQRPGHETPPFDPIDDLAMPLGSKFLDEEAQLDAMNRPVTPPAETDLFPARNENPANITPSTDENELVEFMLRSLRFACPTPASGSASIENGLREIDGGPEELNTPHAPLETPLTKLFKTTGLQYHRAVEDLQGVQQNDEIGRLGQHILQQRVQLDSIMSRLDGPGAQHQRGSSLGHNHQQHPVQSQVPVPHQDQQLLLLKAQQRLRPEPQRQHQEEQQQQPPRLTQQQAPWQYQQQYQQPQHHVASQQQQQFNRPQHPVPSQQQQHHQTIAPVRLPPFPLAPASPPTVYNSTVNGMSKVDRSLWNNDGISKVPPPAPGTFFAPRDWFTRKSDTADAHANIVLNPPRDRDVSQPHSRNLSQSTDQDLSHHGVLRLSPEDRGLGQPQSQNLPGSRAPGFEQYPQNPSQPRTTGCKQHAHNPSQPKIEGFENRSALRLPSQAATQPLLQTPTRLPSQAPSRDATVQRPSRCEAEQSQFRGPPSAEPHDFSRSWPPRSQRSTHHRAVSLPIRTQGTGFKPMHAVTNTRSARDNLNDRLVSPTAKFSINYAGVHNDANASCDDLPEHLNAAVWLTNLPPDISFHELLLAIRGHGRVWCSYINQPDYVKHSTAAAKIVFFEHTAAHRLLKTCWSTTDGLNIRGHSVRIDHNRIKNPSVKEYTNESRCLIITGESWFVNEDSLRARFNAKFVYQLDEVVELYKGNGRTVLEFRFGSWRNQAQMGKMSLEKDRPAGFEKAEYGEDPCETGRDSSYDIAALKARGIEL